ncbi:hypothetical protein REPUB_Repub07fG0223200 [Reevesia pubescens]
MAKARELFLAMLVKNGVTWSAMISGYVECGELELAVEFFELAAVKSVVAWTAMIIGYMKFGKIEEAEKLFKEMPVKNLVSWNAMIAGYVENYRAEDGLNFFRMTLGKQVHQLVCKSLLRDDKTAGTSFLSMYCKCGLLYDGWKLFLVIKRKEVVSRNAMISGYAQHGAGEKDLRLFEEMRDEGIRPDWITFVAVLLACNHAGLVDIEVRYFDSMEKDYGVEARPDHYTCMVDLLGSTRTWEIAEFAAENLLDLDPKSAAGYVQLANIYAAMNKWDHVARSIVHEFRLGDRVHTELASIHEKLNELEKKMKLAGYVPDLEFALHDVGEEQKEKLLLRHSEKLAIAFGLMKVPYGTPIRVFKNSRVCGNCHLAIKHISAIERREIL